MDWSYPDEYLQASDPAGVVTVLTRFAREAGDPPLRGTRFLSSGREMLSVTREIERSLGPGSALWVGFQRAAKLAGEARRYRELAARGVRVTAFGAGESPLAADLGVRWVALPENRARIENHWFLVTEGAEPIAFAGYELSPPELFASGGVAQARRRFAGFASADPRLVERLLDHLRAVAAQAGVDGAILAAAGGAGLLLAATDDGQEGAYARTWRAAVALAARAGARVLLYDRSAESYLVDPYPYADFMSGERLLSRQDVTSLGRHYLARQIDEAAAAGVEAVAWLPRRPGPEQMAEAAARFGAGLAVLPAELETPALLDRVRGNTLERFRAALGMPIVLVTPDGTLRPGGALHPGT